jgi:ABC-type histidine transport system ATPase subunit
LRVTRGRLWTGARPPPVGDQHRSGHERRLVGGKQEHAAISEGCAMRPSAMRFVAASNLASAVEMLFVSG